VTRDICFTISYSAIWKPEQYQPFSFSKEQNAQEHVIEKCNGNQPSLYSQREEIKDPLVVSRENSRGNKRARGEH
jgi:hypothetical protein